MLIRRCERCHKCFADHEDLDLDAVLCPVYDVKSEE